MVTSREAASEVTAQQAHCAKLWIFCLNFSPLRASEQHRDAGLGDARIQGGLGKVGAGRSRGSRFRCRAVPGSSKDRVSRNPKPLNSPLTTRPVLGSLGRISLQSLPAPSAIPPTSQSSKQRNNYTLLEPCLLFSRNRTASTPNPKPKPQALSKRPLQPSGPLPRRAPEQPPAPSQHE